MRTGAGAALVGVLLAVDPNRLGERTRAAGFAYLSQYLQCPAEQLYLACLSEHVAADDRVSKHCNEPQ